MACDGAGECVLGVGVDVHLDNTVGHCVCNLLLGGAGATVEDQVEGLVALAVLSADLGLDFLEQLGAQVNVTGLVHAVNVTEGQSSHVGALLAQADCLNGLDCVCNGGVQGVVDSAFNAVFLATNGTNLNLENKLCLGGTLDQLSSNLQVLVQVDCGAVPHVGVEDGVFTASNSLLRLCQQGQNEAFQLVLGAVVGVQCNVHVVLLSNFACVCCEGEGANDHVLLGSARPVCCTAGGCLDDAVRASLCEAADSSVQGLGGGHVHCGVREALFLRGLQHFCVNFGGCNSHMLTPWIDATGYRGRAGSPYFVGARDASYSHYFTKIRLIYR